MMLTPGYGETPLPRDEYSALLPGARELLGEPVTKAAVYDLEQALYEVVAQPLILETIAGTLQIDDLLTDYFLRDLHRRLYSNIWNWAGIYRKREINIGVAPEQIAADLRGALETIRYRWEYTNDWSPRELGIVTHAEGVRVHPFIDGNGRARRLHADLVFLAAQDGDKLELYDWHLEKRTYIELLRAYDHHRDPHDLAAYIGTRSLDD